VTAIRLVSTIAVAPDPGMTVVSVHVGLWELLMVSLMVVSFALVLSIYGSTHKASPPPVAGYIGNPPLLNFLFGDKKSAPFWVVVRFYVGFVWLSAGYAKLVDEAWMVNGAALRRFWLVATTSTTQGQNPRLAYDWYHAFLFFMLNHGWYTWLAKFITVGELAVGVCLLCGAFVGIAALFGAALNFNYALAGSAGANTVLMVLGGMLITTWTVAGYIGLDRYLLPRLGTPWQREKEPRRQRPGVTRA
jgi:thiosulfate dehydrogenase [quinone] large subunit